MLKKPSFDGLIPPSEEANLLPAFTGGLPVKRVDNLASPAMGLMDRLNSAEVCDDLVSTFVTEEVDPDIVSFDDLIDL